MFQLERVRLSRPYPHSKHGSAMNEPKEGSIVQQYSRFTGTDAGPAQLIIPDFIAMKQANNGPGSHAEIGSLGTALQDHHIHTYVYGDLQHAPFMLMNNQGLVEYGQLGEREGEGKQNRDSEGLTTRNALRASGITTNYTQLLTVWQATLSPSVVVLELGDLQRLYKEQRQYEPDIFEGAKVEVLQEMDQFIGKISRELKATDQLWIFSPFVHADAWNKSWRFSPLLIGQAGDDRARLLYSPSTHRQGMVSMYDLAPSILRQFDIELPQRMIGLPLSTTPATGTLSQLMQLNEQVAQVYKLRPQLLYPFVIYEIIVLLIALLLVLLQWTNGYRMMSIPLYTILLSPLTMLLMGWLVKLGWSTQMLVTFFVLFLFITSWVATQFKVYSGLITICALTVIVLFIDGFTGVYAMRSSILGYDPLIGARYYGVGNEYMGVWIGAAIVGVAGSIQVMKRQKIAIIASALLFIGILLYMASPAWGRMRVERLQLALHSESHGFVCLISGCRYIVQVGKLILWISIFIGFSLLGLWILNGGRSHLE